MTPAPAPTPTSAKETIAVEVDREFYARVVNELAFRLGCTVEGVVTLLLEQALEGPPAAIDWLRAKSNRGTLSHTNVWEAVEQGERDLVTNEHSDALNLVAAVRKVIAK